MRSPRSLGLSTVLTLLLGLTFVAGPVSSTAPAVAAPARATAAAASTDPVFHAVSGGTRVNVAGVVRSELSAASTLRAETAPRTAENKTANIDLLNGVIHVDGVTSRQTTRAVLGGTQVASEAKIAGVSIFDGLITADAIETKATATIDGGGVRRNGFTKLIGVKIGDQRIPINVAKNTAIVIPGVLRVVVNEVRGQVGGDALIKSQATGLRITLLKPRDGLSAGASIEITPTQARILLPVPIDGEPAFGFAYSTRVGVHVGDAVNVLSAPTGVVMVPAGGTNGVDITNSTARAFVPGIATIHGLANTANAVVTEDATDSTLTARIGKVNLLDGAIQLDAITAWSHVAQNGANPPTKSAGAEILGLVIGGEPIPVGVEPNTVIEIPGLVRIVINEQTDLPFPYNGVAVRALHITALPGAPDELDGVDIEVGVAATWVNR
ncbi:choice-of-anchor P family protein [Nocardioides stalactiti]|uniref:choice-of-anchor P family protein n=1 Tax=Nocardioides stalactiti TaxID=2755356 RepID=UPI001603791F|nr:choice-of-anchor P family protein [Nocardioides stalactiti]